MRRRGDHDGGDPQGEAASVLRDREGGRARPPAAAGGPLRRRRRRRLGPPVLAALLLVLLVLLLPRLRAGRTGGRESRRWGLRAAGGISGRAPPPPQKPPPPPFRLTIGGPGGGAAAPPLPSCSAPLRPDRVAYTLVTQVSEDRLWMVREHCATWGGDGGGGRDDPPPPISVAVYTDRTAEDVRAAILGEGPKDELAGEGRGTAGPDACLGTGLSVRVLPTADQGKADYPVNALRNLALAGVRTSHAVYLDIDFYPSARLRSALELGRVRAELAADPRLALVVPAYMLHGRSLCGEGEGCREKEQKNGVPRTMEELRVLIASKDVGQFDEQNWNGHGSTSYGAFLLQEEGELLDLPCVNSNRYEPYLAFRYCDGLPPFQEAFTGYGKNKMTWVMQLRRTGYDFAQLGGAFAVHSPHGPSEARKSWNSKAESNLTNVDAAAAAAVTNAHRHGAKKAKGVRQKADLAQTKRGQVDMLYLKFCRWMEENVLDQTRVQMCDETYTDEGKLWANSGQDEAE